MASAGLLRLTGGLPPKTVIATYALGAAGILPAWALSLPLPMLLGPLLVVGGVAMAGIRLFGAPVAVPQAWRYALIPIIGVAIGASVPPDFAQQVLTWWPTALALFFFVPLAHALSYALYHRAGGLDPMTAYFSAMPGGFIEALEMGEQNGARMDMLVVLQFLRLLLCIVAVPLAFSLATGRAVGSGAVEIPGAALPIGLADAFWLIGAGLLGLWLARRLRLPAPVLSGPILLSALVHAAGLTAAVPPLWMVAVTQWVVGSSLGARLAGFDRRSLWLAMRLSLASVVLVLTLAGAFALALHGAVAQPAAAVLLAFAPGGISEMSLVALSLQMSAVYVTLHHLLRIVMTVIFARIGLRLLPR